MKKRLFSLLLALVLICTLVPLGIPAAQALGGSCGANATWEFDTETGLLTISGSGPTADWESWDSLPWAAQRSRIKAVKINSGITRLGDSAFHNCKNIESVSFPDTLTEIGEACFRFDEHITSLSLPAKLKTIEAHAFSYCHGLTTVTIPATVTAIGSRAFSACRGLKSIQVASGNAVYASYGGCLYSKSMGVLYQVPAGMSGSFTVPSGVGSVQEYGFEYCENLTSVTLPASLKVIGTGCFSYCLTLQEITIPQNVKRIEYYTFARCSSLTAATLPEGLTSIGSMAFHDCPKLKTIPLPTSLQELGQEAFSHCYALTEVTIPKNVTSIDPAPYAYCKGLYRFIVDPDNPAFKNDSYGVLITKDGKTLVQCPANKAVNYALPATVTKIRHGAFYGCVNLPSVKLPDGLTEIGMEAFMSCTKLTSVVIPTTVINLNESAFRGCSLLSTVTVPNSVRYIGKDVFRECASGLAIFGARGSKAEAYAQENRIPFVCELSIEAHPASVSRSIGQKAVFQVSAEGAGLRYQWQYKKVGQEDWTDWANQTSDSLTVTASSTNGGCQYRCKVSNQCGTLESSPATLTVTAVSKPVITAHPKDATVALGSTTTFKVTASGSGLSYQWQFRKAGTSTWYDWSGKTSASLPVTGSNTNNQCQYRCVVSNAAGHVNSAAATLTVTGSAAAPTITTNPSAAKVPLGTTVSFKVVASGSGLGYQWQFSKDNGANWYDWFGKTAATLSVKASTTNNGCLYRCKVTNSGGSVTSSSARLTVSDIQPTIVVQPANATVALGKTTTMKVVAAGSGLTYQWQFSKNGGATWSNWSGKTAYKLEITGSATNNGCLYRCVVKNAYGSVTSAVAKLTVT